MRTYRHMTLSPAVFGLALAVPVVLSACTTDDTASAQSYAYVPNAGDGTVSVIDMKALEVKRTITVSEGEGASTSHGVAVSADGKRLFVGDAAKGVLKVIETTDYTIEAEIDLGINVHGIDVTPDARRVIASGSRLPDKDHKFTFIVDATRNEVLAKIDTNISGHGDTTPDGRFMYLNDITQHRIAVIDLDKNEVATEVISGPATWPEDAVGPNEVAFAPDGLTAYSADYGAQTLSIIDTKDPRAPKVTGTIAIEKLPHGIAITRDGKEIWVSNRDSKDVVVIDRESHEELARMSMAPYQANHVALTPDSKQAYVTLTATEEMGDQTGYVAVIDVATREEIARMAVGVAPHEISFED